jgi:ribonuclease-3
VAGEARRQRLRALLARAGADHVSAATFERFDAAFVHESAVKKEKLAPESNERLEFVGDAVLGYAVARSLYDRFPDASEGELALRKSSLVSDTALAATAERLGFDALLVLGGSLANGPPARRRSALGDAFEAFLAVLQRECGWAVAEAFVLREHVLERERLLGGAIDDPKTILQEWSQRRHLGAVPAYQDRREGPDHEPTFFTEVVIGDVRGTGSGPSKQDAQRAAAANALEELSRRYDDVGPRELSRPRPGSALATAAPKRRRKRAPGQPSASGTAKRRRS